MWFGAESVAGKCGTCASPGCHCDTGLAWTSASCMVGYCMRCWQHADGSTETQVASLGSSCPVSKDAMAQACSTPNLQYKAIYEIGSQCIDFGSGNSVNCVAAGKHTLILYAQACVLLIMCGVQCSHTRLQLRLASLRRGRQW